MRSIVAVAGLVGFATAARADEAIAIVDARSGDVAMRAAGRADLAIALRTIDGLAPVGGARAVALTGDDDTTDGAQAEAALVEVRDRFGALDCAGVREPGQRAVQLLAGREAAGLDEQVRLRAAWSYLLLCADRDGARGPAQGFADRLRTLGGAPAIPAEVWARYPEIDAGSELALTELVIKAPAMGVPVAGAAVWVDHRRVGVAPMTVMVASGGHVLALARGSDRVGLVLLVAGGTIDVAVGLHAFASDDGGLATQVRRWQAGAPVRAAEVGALLTTIEARFAVVVEGDQRASVWARDGEAEATVVFAGELDQPLPIAHAIRDQRAAWTRGPDPDRPLITEDDLAVSAASRSPKQPAPW